MKLLCPVEGDPPPLTMWTKDGRTIHSGWTRFRVLRQGLKIKEVEAEDAGTFICKATNGFGSININYTLIVIGPPRIADKVIHRQTVRIGRTMKLLCPVEGDPPPLTMWTKDGRTIHSGWTRFRVLRQGLKIKEVEAEDAGTFICKATNGFGSININYTLIVIVSCGRTRALSVQLSVAAPTILPWPVIIGIPAGAIFIFGTILLWLCQTKKKPCSSPSSAAAVAAQSIHRQPPLRERICLPQVPDKDCGSSMNYEEYLAQQQHLLAQGPTLALTDPKPHIPSVMASPSSSLPWPVIIGIPAGAIFIFGTILLWLCQTKKKPCSSPSSVAAVAAQSIHRQPPLRERICLPQVPDKDCGSSMNYEEYLAQQQHLLAQGPTLASAMVPKMYPKIYTDIHTHTHQHVDGKIHQHQHIHYQC
ncbi:UNVERIFIED_CONTAM: hypothetical protein FKN15_004396 [Acipenser sinensis]